MCSQLPGMLILYILILQVMQREYTGFIIVKSGSQEAFQENKQKLILKLVLIEI